MSTPMLGVVLEKRSPLKDLVLIEVIAGPGKDKGKSREQDEMDEGAIKKAQSPSLTMLEYASAFYEGDGLSCIVGLMTKLALGMKSKSM